MADYTAREVVRTTGTWIVLATADHTEIATYSDRLPFDDFVEACAKRGDRVFFARADGSAGYIAGDIGSLLA